MQIHIKKLTACLIVIFLPLSILFAQDFTSWPVLLDKKFEKSYPLNGEKIVLNNQFGKMEIETWDKNELKVIAFIKIGAREKEVAERCIDMINVVDDVKDNTIEIRTKIDNDRNYWEGNRTNSREIKIDYKVYLPKTANLFAENSFGNIDLGDFDGEAELWCKYGNLTAGNFSKPVKISVDFGRANIGSVNNSKINAKYSRIEVEKLNGDLDAKFEFCQSVDLMTGDKVKSMSFHCNYTNLNIELQKGAAVNYSMQLNNGSLNNRTNYTIEEKAKSENRNYYYSPVKKYEGSFGKAENALQLTIKSNFGKVRLAGA